MENQKDKNETEKNIDKNIKEITEKIETIEKKLKQHDIQRKFQIHEAKYLQFFGSDF